MDDDLKIEFADAEQSIEIKKGLAALLQTSADQEQRLLDIARRQHEQAKRYRQLYEAEHTKNQALQTRYDALLCENEQLRNSFFHNPTISDMLQAAERSVLAGQKTSFVAAKQLLDAYFALLH